MSVHDKTLLVVGGGREAVEGILIARDMGLRVVVSDIDPSASGFEYADDRLIASTYDTMGTAAKAKEYSKSVRKIDGVISIGADVPLTVAQTAYRLGLPHIPIHTATICSDKLIMARVLHEAGVDVPGFKAIGGLMDLLDLDYLVERPIVLKPVDSRGARGVIRLVPGDGVPVPWAYNEAMSESKIKQLILQEWLDGPQVSIEGVVLNGKYHHIATIDRNYSKLNEYSPYVIEDGGSQPSILSTEVIDNITNLLQQATAAIGLKYGTLKGDIVVHDGLPYIIEVAPRLSGGYMSTIQIPLATGVNIVKHAINICLGKYPQPNELVPQQLRAVAIRYYFPLTPIKNHTQRGKHYIGTGDTREDAIREAETGIREMESGSL